MKKVPLKELKENLAHWAEVAALGESLEVTKHNKPYIMLIPCALPHVRAGQNVGKIFLTPALKKDPTRRAWLDTLLEDRHD